MTINLEDKIKEIYKKLNNEKNKRIEPIFLSLEDNKNNIINNMEKDNYKLVTVKISDHPFRKTDYLIINDKVYPIENAVGGLYFLKEAKNKFSEEESLIPIAYHQYFHNDKIDISKYTIITIPVTDLYPGSSFNITI